MPEDLRPKDLSSAQVAGNTSKSADSPTSHEKEGGIALDPSNETACRQFFDRAQTTPGFFDKVGLVQDTYWSVPFEQLMFLLLEQDEETIRNFLTKCPLSIDSKFLDAFLNILYEEVTDSNARALAQYLVDVFENVHKHISDELYSNTKDFIITLVKFKVCWEVLVNLNLSIILSYRSMLAENCLNDILFGNSQMIDFLIAYSDHIKKRFRQQYPPNFSTSESSTSEFYSELFQQKKKTVRSLLGHNIFYSNTGDEIDNHLKHQSIAIYPNTALDGLPSFFVRKNSKDAISALAKAREVLSDFVSSSYYPELPEIDEEESTNSIFQGTTRRYKIGRHGYREVYAGETIGNFRYYTNIPSELLKDIYAQRDYILIQLLRHGIHHNHPHDWNFNVRWLLKNKDGSINTLAFTAERALDKAQKENLTITPIVTLRDWKLAEYHPEEAWEK